MMSRGRAKAKEEAAEKDASQDKKQVAKKESEMRKRKAPKNENKIGNGEHDEMDQEPKRKRGKKEIAKDTKKDLVENAENTEKETKPDLSESGDSKEEKEPETKKRNGRGGIKAALKESPRGKKKPNKSKVEVKVENDDAPDEKKPKTSSKTSKKKNAVVDEPVPRPVKYESLGEGPAPVPSTGQKYMGCHVSGAGGVWLAFDNAVECNAKSFALFLRNQRQWAAKALDDATVEKWKEAAKDMPPHLILPHGSYLMNLGSPNPETLEKSRNMLLEELQRCEKLGIPHYNFHPGSTTGLISREECCKLIAESINIGLAKTKGVICVLENMSCQGFTVGGDLHELRLIIEHVEDRSRVGVCIDTCHTHAAGYDLSSESGFNTFIEDFGKIIGWNFLRGLHINDSKGKVGDHKDRHENIGKGTIGIEGFRRVMNCDYFNDLPLILETPWTSNEGYAKEIKKLEGLVKK